MGRDVKSNLEIVLSGLGMDVEAWAETISPFRSKLELLFTTKRYARLLRSLFSSKSLPEFNGYVFEVLFAYDFESRGHPLKYELKQLPSGVSSVDFCYDFDAKRKLYFELRAVAQRAWITASIDSQLNAYNVYRIELDGQEQREEIFRLQNRIMEKVQDESGNPIRFREPGEGVYNFIVVNVSEIQLRMFDKWDCLLTMYGDAAVPEFFRMGIFGLCQPLRPDSSDGEKALYDKFGHFRETIHGVLFVRFGKDGSLGRLHIDKELEYFLIGNNSLLKKEESDLIGGRLGSFLKKWSRERAESS